MAQPTCFVNWRNDEKQLVVIHTLPSTILFSIPCLHWNSQQ